LKLKLELKPKLDSKPCQRVASDLCRMQQRLPGGVSMVILSF